MRGGCGCVVLPNGKDLGIILEGLPASLQISCKDENVKGGKGIHVELDIFFCSCHIKFYEEITFSLFIACMELHRNVSVTTEMISPATRAGVSRPSAPSLLHQGTECLPGLLPAVGRERLNELPILKRNSQGGRSALQEVSG